MKEVCRRCLHLMVLRASGEALPAGYCDFKDAVVELWEHCEFFEEADEFSRERIMEDLKRFYQGAIVLLD